jgi:hypothetical protein
MNPPGFKKKKRFGTSGPAEQLIAAQEGPYFLELISNFVEVRGNSGCLYWYYPAFYRRDR